MLFGYGSSLGTMTVFVLAVNTQTREIHATKAAESKQIVAPW
jgi:hypothetical protein